MAAQSSSASPSSPSNNNKKNENLSEVKSSKPSNIFDPKNFNLEDINPEMIEKIKSLVDSANSLMTQAEREYNEEVKRKEIERKKQWDDTLEKATRKEVFEIPPKSTKTYRFIGYDTQQFKEIMSIGRQADDIEKKNSEEYLNLEEQVFLKTILYSLEGISEDVLKKLPRKQVWWLYEVMKSKNENPLPFEANE